MKTRIHLLSISLLLAAPAARAEPWTAVKGETPAVGAEIPRRAASSYCEYLKGVASAESALLVAPSLFVTGGLVNVTPVDPTGAATSQAPSARISAGAAYSFGTLYRGLAVKTKADAECEAYRHFSELLAFIAHNKEGLSAVALKAREGVLDASMGRAQEILRSARQRLADGRATQEEVEATELRVDTMRVARQGVKKDIEVANGMPDTSAKSIVSLVAERAAAERKAEEEAAKVRSSYGWDVSVRAGYDQVLGFSQKVPVFAMATASVNLGWFFQGSGNDRAIEARPPATRWALEGGSQPAIEAARRMREAVRAERARLADVVILLGDVEQRMKAAEAVEGDKPKALADMLWFDAVTLRAEQAFLEEHLRHMKNVLGEASP
jgi:hypothetical protein